MANNSITNKHLAERLDCIEKRLPNGELQEIHENVKEIKEILDGEGVTPGYIIQVFKQVCDLADKDGDRLRALENLAKIAGLFETEKKSEQLTVFAGFTDEQMKAISDGQSKKLTTTKQKS